MSTYAVREKNTFNGMRPLLQMCIQYFYKGILYCSFLLLRKTIWLPMICWGHTLFYNSKVVQASTHTINKFSPLIVYLEIEATMTTHKLIKKRSYHQSCPISDWFGSQPFSEIMNLGNKMAVANHPRGRAKI